MGRGGLVRAESSLDADFAKDGARVELRCQDNLGDTTE